MGNLHLRGLLATSALFSLTLAPIAEAGTYTDDFDDDTLTPPWTDVEGTNTESDGQFHTGGMSSATHAGPVITQVIPQAIGEEHLYFSGSVLGGGGSGFVLKQNGTDRCGAYVWTDGSIWLTGDSPTESNVGMGLLVPPATTPFLLGMEIDGTLLTIFIDNLQVWQGEHSQCNFVTDGTAGINLHTGRTAHWDDFNLSWYEADSDGDGYCPGDFCSDSTALPGDCDDGDAANFPGNTETCDGQDNNCDGLADEADPLLVGAQSWYVDGDGDGYGDPTSEVSTCVQPPGTIADGTDCDDSDSAINPGATEICDGIDNDCVGGVDDVPDDDGDGMGPCVGDCDDTDPTVYLDAPELCDGIDNDCDGAALVSEVDSDGDGQMVCDGDCNDTDPSIYIGATETCSGFDDNCDGVTLSGEVDGDGDGVLLCDGDCNDGNSTVFPGAPELCNGLDDDCDGATGLGEVDADSDGVLVCDGDCDDSNPNVQPDQPEVCNGVDDDCDGAIDDDDDDVLSQPTWYTDSDGDGFGDATTAVAACSQPAGGVLTSTDCDDSNDTVYPGADELCDRLDNDCDGAATEDEVDLDSDGVMICDGDCDDDNAEVSPEALEVCSNAIDDNCNGLVDEDFDLDGDGFQSCDEDCDDEDATVHPGAEELCDGLDNDCDGVLDEVELDSDGDGWAPCDGDCDDTDPDRAPGAVETCDDDLDMDCDGIPGHEGEDCLEALGPLVSGGGPGPECGCTSAGSGQAGHSWTALLLGIVALLRRRR